MAKSNDCRCSGSRIGFDGGRSVCQVGAYHRGIGIGETPNIDRLANEGGMFTTW